MINYYNEGDLCNIQSNMKIEEISVRRHLFEMYLIFPNRQMDA